MRALQVLAGPTALKCLRERGLQPQDIRAIPAAAGGPKGLILNPLDRFLFGQWLPRSKQVVHLLGASIGAWRMACACLPDADAALAQLAADYIAQRYEHQPGKAPKPRHVSELFAARLGERFGGREHEVLSHPRYRLPVPTHDYRTHHVELAENNLGRSILASCTIPFWLEAVDSIPGGPPGPYWDGGITDYHLHLDYAVMANQQGASGAGGLVLYPHFQKTLVPGWLDKALRHRHRASERLANVVLLSPSPEWVATLPGSKLPDRSDFKAFGDDHDARERVWTRATAESGRLAEEFEALTRQPSVEAMPLP